MLIDGVFTSFSWQQNKGCIFIYQPTNKQSNEQINYARYD